LSTTTSFVNVIFQSSGLVSESTVTIRLFLRSINHC
jgi:hypothetical protein